MKKISKSFAALLVTGTLFTAFPNDSKAATSVSGTVELKQNLNLRSNSSWSASSIRVLNKGTKWKAYAVENGFYNLGGNQWIPAGNEYVSFSGTTVNPNPPTASSETVVELKQSLNLRSGNTWSSPVVRVLDKGSKWKTYGLSNGFYSLGGNQWIPAGDTYVKVVSGETPKPPEEKPDITSVSGSVQLKQSLNLRSDSSWSAPSLRVLDKGSQWKVYGERNGFYNLGGNQWVPSGSDFVTFYKDGTNPPVSPPTNNKITGVVTADSLNVRSGPSVSYGTVGTVYKNQEVTVLSESNGWGQIERGTIKGYVNMSYVSKNTGGNNGGNTTNPPVTSAYSPLYYQVKTGESVFSIAEKFNITADQLKQLNGFTSNSLTSGNYIKVSASQFMKPAKGVYTSGFGGRWGTTHFGMDMSQYGDVEVQAAYDGVVSRSYTSSSYGEVVFIRHNIAGKTYETVYAHMRNRGVKEGDTVKQGQYLGHMGNTGDSTGQHLHWEVHENGPWNAEKSYAVDPSVFLVK